MDESEESNYQLAFRQCSCSGSNTRINAVSGMDTSQDL